jgi:alkylation response protein AidB-like acyl-CoA dehydrogenase
MDFGISEEQALLQATVADFLAKECPISRVRELFDADADAAHDPALWKGLCELGLAGILVPERFGGAGLGLVDLALAAEALGRGATPGPFLGHALATLAVLEGGSDAQKERWLPRLASGEALGSVALGEPGGRWEPESWTAALAGGRISGTKSFALGASAADLVVVGAAGGELVLVEPAAAGVEIEPIDGLDRTRRADALRLADAPCERLADGARAATRVRDAGLALLAADAFGGASRLVELSVEYAKARVQFGVPIAQFQAVKHKLADMAVEIEPARGLYWWAAHAFDALPDEQERACAIAKAHLTDRFAAVARDAVEIHGGIGFTWECDVQFWFKRAVFDRQFLGEPAHHRERALRLAGL